MGETEKHVVLSLQESFRFTNNLTQAKNMTVDQKYSSVKINFMAVSKLADIPKTQVLQAINSLFEAAAEALLSHSQLDLDLGQLGRLSLADSNVTFSPYVKSKHQMSHSKQTVQHLMDQSRLHHKSLLATGKVEQKEKEKEKDMTVQMNLYNSQINRSQFNKNM